VGDLIPQAGPQGLRLVDRLGRAVADAKLDRKCDVVGVLADQPLDAMLVEKLRRVVLEEQRDPRTGLFLGARLDGELASAVRAPLDAVLCRIARLAARDLHPLGDDERRVEADAELADQLRVLALIAGQLLEEPLRPGMSDRAELL